MRVACSADFNYRLGVRTLLELKGYLSGEFPEDFVECNGCKEIVAYVRPRAAAGGSLRVASSDRLHVRRASLASCGRAGRDLRWVLSPLPHPVQQAVLPKQDSEELPGLPNALDFCGAYAPAARRAPAGRGCFLPSLTTRWGKNLDARLLPGPSVARMMTPRPSATTRRRVARVLDDNARDEESPTARRRSDRPSGARAANGGGATPNGDAGMDVDE